MVFAVAYRLTDSSPDARDVLQDVFVYLPTASRASTNEVRSEPGCASSRRARRCRRSGRANGVARFQSAMTCQPVPLTQWTPSRSSERWPRSRTSSGR